MPQRDIRLKALLRQRHWQTYRTFCSEYDKAAGKVDQALMGKWPSRVQLHRWLSGGLKGLPYSDHCRVLEAMFPGESAEQLFNIEEPSTELDHKVADTRQLFATVASGFNTPPDTPLEWEIASSYPRDSGNGDTRQGIASSANRVTTQDVGDGLVAAVGRRIVMLKKTLRLSQDEARLIASLAGNVVELDLNLEIDIAADGQATVVYRHQVLNISDRPITRLPREIWFKHSSGRIDIAPGGDTDRRTIIQRVHSTPSLVKFACQVSPAIQPGEVATVQYSCTGGRFLDEYYWHQSVTRYVRHLTISIRHRGVGELTECTATREYADGSENPAAEDLLWDYDGSDIILSLTSNYLSPNEAVRLRWETDREAEG